MKWLAVLVTRDSRFIRNARGATFTASWRSVCSSSSTEQSAWFLLIRKVLPPHHHHHLSSHIHCWQLLVQPYLLKRRRRNFACESEEDFKLKNGKLIRRFCSSSPPWNRGCCCCRPPCRQCLSLTFRRGEGTSPNALRKFYSIGGGPATKDQLVAGTTMGM